CRRSGFSWRSGSEVSRQFDRELGAAAGIVLGPQAAAVALDDRLADGEPQSGASLSHLGGEEGLEDLLARRLGDAGTGVAYRDAHTLRIRHRSEEDLTALRHGV